MNNTLLNSWKSYLPFIIVGFLAFLVYELYAFIDGLLGAIILYVLLRPMMKRLVAKRWRKGLAATTLMLSSFVIIVIPILIICYLIISKMTVAFGQAASLVDTFHSFNERIRGY